MDKKQAGHLPADPLTSSNILVGARGFECAYGTHENLTGVLEEDDPIVSRFGFILTILGILQSAIESNREKVTPIEPDDMSQEG